MKFYAGDASRAWFFSGDSDNNFMLDFVSSSTILAHYEIGR